MGLDVHSLDTVLFQRMLSGGGFRLEVGNLLGIVWVTDRDGVDSYLADPSELYRRLGLPFTGDRLFYAYERSQVPGDRLQVPRCLDAIDHPNFRPEVNCGAHTGRTIGDLPEAIHEGTWLTLDTL